MAAGLPAIQQLQGSVIDAGRQFTVPAYQYFAQQATTLLTMQQSINKNLGVNTLTLAQAQALTPGLSDAGLVVFITTYAHLVYWDGTAWQWMDGDLPGHLGDWAAAPSTGWALCDGSATTFLTVGATLGTSNFTTPNLKGTPSYKKSGAAYAGTLVAPTAPGISGSTAAGTTGTGTTGTGTTGTGTTGTGTTGTDTTGTESSGHTHTYSGNTGTESTPDFDIVVAGATLVSGGPHTHSYSGTTSGESATHTHSVPGLSVPGLSVPGLSVPGLSVPGLTVPALGAGTLTVDATADPEHLVVLPYVRR